MCYETDTKEVLKVIRKYREMVPENSGSLFGYNIEAEVGEISVKGISKADLYSVAIYDARNGSVSEWHRHDESQHLVLVSGESFILEMNGGREEDSLMAFRINRGAGRTIPPLTLHRIRADRGDIAVVAVMVPGSEDFPRGPGD